MAAEFMEWRGRLPRFEDIPNPATDGDTCWLETDQGDFYRKVRDIRLRGVHAPEKKQRGWGDCRDVVSEWLDRWNVGKWPFWVHTYRTSTYRDSETLARVVGEVFNHSKSESLNVHIQKFIDEQGFPGGTGA